MNTISIRLSLAALLVSCMCTAQTSLKDSQVSDAINRALFGKRHTIGLTLNDVQTNLLSGLMCETCRTTGYTIYVYTPESWIELKAVQARREMLPFGLTDVTPEMRLPFIHVLASPSQPEYLNASGMGMASSVHRVVLSSTDRSDVVQPLSESHGQEELNSALRSFTQASAGAVFSLADVERLRSEDPNHEFFIVVVGDNKNKYFKVKSRFFKQLFGTLPEPIYSEAKPASISARPAEARANEDAEQPIVSRTEPVPLPAPQTPEPVKVVPISPQPRAVEPSQPSNHSGGPVSRSEEIEGTGSNAYKRDNALVAQWWNLNQPAANSPATSNATFRANVPNGETSPASIGAWTDEKPTIRHDGVRVDHLIQGGPADKVGVEVGDDILALGGVYVFTAEELMDDLHRYNPGDRVALRFRRRSTIYDTFIIMGSEERR